MLCPKCGVKIRDGLTFCPKCGAEFGRRNDPRLIEAEPVNHGSGNTSSERSFTDDSFIENGNISIGRSYYDPVEPPMRKRFYQKTWFIIVMLILIWPVGVFLMWKFSNWNIAVKSVVSAVFAFALINTVFDGDNKPEKSVSDVQTETTETQPATTAPTTESLEDKYKKEADGLIAERQGYYDRLEFGELAEEADTLLADGKDVLDEDDQAKLTELSQCATALDHIYSADYTFSKDNDPSIADFETLEDSQYCPEEVYDVLTGYEEYNNQRWKRKDIEKHDYGTDKTTYVVTAFSSFRLKDEDQGFNAENIEPTMKLSVKYTEDGDTTRGSKEVSADKVVDESAKIKLSDGTKCSVSLSRQKDISLKVDGTKRTLSNVVTASSDIVHKKDLTTKVAETTERSYSSCTVYITNTGGKYHSSGCSYLKSSKIAISKDDAEAQGYEPCSRCHP